MATKKTVAPPIDRPLQKAYLRQFAGWSTAHPPNMSDANSCRVMENMMVSRDGGIRVRPGMRYLPYADVPRTNSFGEWVEGMRMTPGLLGEPEPFYMNNGEKALLIAWRDPYANNTVGFRVILERTSGTCTFALHSPEIAFRVPSPPEQLNFTANTKHVKFLQIDNKIFALSDAGEPMRLFMVGAEKIAKRMNGLTLPGWNLWTKPQVVQPNKAWIDRYTGATRFTNLLINPSFEAGPIAWEPVQQCDMSTTKSWPAVTRQSLLRVKSKPQRTNLATSPLHDVPGLGIVGWSALDSTTTTLQASSSYLRVQANTGSTDAFAQSVRLGGIEAEENYRLGFSFANAVAGTVRARISFHALNGTMIDQPKQFTFAGTSGNVSTPKISAPLTAAFARIYLGFESAAGTGTGLSADFNNVYLSKFDEAAVFTHGSQGTNYYWLGTANRSASVYWPPVDVVFRSSPTTIGQGTNLRGSMHVRTLTGGHKTVELETVAENRYQAQTNNVSVSATSTSSWQRLVTNMFSPASGAIATYLQVTIRNVGKDESYGFDAGMIADGDRLAEPLEPPGLHPVEYFDGSTPNSGVHEYEWLEPSSPHLSASQMTNHNVYGPEIPSSLLGTAVAPTADTLTPAPVAGVDYRMGFFYTFENEVGESAASKITEIEIRRPPSAWKWQKPNSATEPDPAQPTDNELECADQLVVHVASVVYARAIAEGATHWNLYAMSWSKQDPVPVTAQLVKRVAIYPDAAASVINEPKPHAIGGRVRITPQRMFNADEVYLPSEENRVNYSIPSSARNGLVAGDRMILVGDASAPATIKWSSNRPGYFTSFSDSKGGGQKTLSSGNLNLPGSVALWQNPQSVDTLTVLCLGNDGSSTCYYMSPSEVTAQTSSVGVMGFEETTNTPGTTSPYASLVHNNAMYRPLDRALLKSTAQNYNINHKTMSDEIANMWAMLLNKDWIMAAAYDNRIYVLVHNPLGEPLEDGCHGNEIWMLDTQGDQQGAWSRFLIQGSALRAIEFGSQVYMGVTRPDGLYYLDPNARTDDYIKPNGSVGQRDIPWYFEMNTQGANRARDAWAHLQQISVMFSNYNGAVKYGIRGRTIQNKNIQMEKEFTDPTNHRFSVLTWDVEDHLLIRRDLKEWYFYAGSVEGKHGSGGIGYVQYRFTPVTVNVGYEHGSVETFEYGRNTDTGPDIYSQVGIVRDTQDFTWERT